MWGEKPASVFGAMDGFAYLLPNIVRCELSLEPETMRLPSLENTTEVTESVWLLFSVCFSSPIMAFHTQIDLS